MPYRVAARRPRLFAALGFLEIRWRLLKPDAAGALERWMSSWPGLGAVVDGMTSQGFDVEPKQYPRAWRASFYPTGIAHSIVHGSAYEATPWRAVQRAAWGALNDSRTAAQNKETRMEGLIEIHVLPRPEEHSQAGTRLIGLDNQGRVWCGVLVGELGMSPTVRWIRAIEERAGG